MPVEPSVTLTGFDELERFLKKLPAEAANQLQAVEVKNFIEHRKEIMRSHGFASSATRRIGRAMKIKPEKRVERTRIQDVKAEIATWWKGVDIQTPEEGVAARVEKRVGKSTTRPIRKQFLLIPWGDFLTAQGRPRRKQQTIRGVSGRFPIKISKLPNTRIVRFPDGKLRMVQTLKPGERGQFESSKGVRRSKLGTRERVVGILVREAKVTQGLDFFGSWDRLESSRNQRYDRMLERLIE